MLEQIFYREGAKGGNESTIANKRKKEERETACLSLVTVMGFCWFPPSGDGQSLSPVLLKKLEMSWKLWWFSLWSNQELYRALKLVHEGGRKRSKPWIEFLPVNSAREKKACRTTETSAYWQQSGWGAWNLIQFLTQNKCKENISNHVYHCLAWGSRVFAASCQIRGTLVQIIVHSLRAHTH